MNEDLVDEIVEMLVNGYDIKEIEKKYQCSIDFTEEKHHALQYTFYYTVKLPDGKPFYVEIENGINNGTVVRDINYEGSTLTKTKTIVVSKLVFDLDRFESVYGNDKDRELKLKIAESKFNENKSLIDEMDRHKSYDDYVTGGGTNKTDSYYSKNREKFKDVFYTYEFVEIEVDRNLKN